MTSFLNISNLSKSYWIDFLYFLSNYGPGKTQRIWSKFCKALVTMYHVKANLCFYVTNWNMMAVCSTLKYCYSSRIDKIWPKFSKTLVTIYYL